MINFHFRFMLFFVLVACCVVGYAQKNQLAMKACVKKDRVLLRWATADKNLWELGIKYGYKLERLTLKQISDSGNFQSANLLTSVPVKPRTKQDSIYWIQLLKRNNKAALVYQSLYPKSFSTPPTAEKIKASQMFYGLMLLACDQHAELAGAAGLSFIDSTISKNCIYAYRISLFDPPTNRIYKPVTIIVDARNSTAIQKVDSLTGSFSQKKVILRWNFLSLEQDYCGYFVERSADGLNYEQLNSVPYLIATTNQGMARKLADYTDTVPQLNQTYYYRICGLTHFGEKGPPGNTIAIRAKVELESFPVIDSAGIKNGRQSVIHWRMQSPFDFKLLQGYAIYRASKADGPFALINSTLLESSSSQFIDEHPKTINYYKVCAISTGQDSVYSFAAMVQLEDIDPPAVPKGLSGIVSKSGVVQLNWHPNNEIDLKGYRVFRCNSLNEEFVEVSKKIITDTTFRDSININTLCKNIYYSVLALDYVYNTSRKSPPLLLKRPDKYAPVPALFNQTYFSATGVHLHWVRSSSDDVSNYTLNRKSANEASSTGIKEWAAADTVSSFTDTTVIAEQDYTYFLATLDSSGNRAVSENYSLHFEPGVRKKIIQFGGICSRDKRQIELKWEYRNPSVKNFILYRNKKNEAPRIYKTLAGTATNFTDKQLNINNIYFYYLRAVLANGVETFLSEPVEINY